VLNQWLASFQSGILPASVISVSIERLGLGIQRCPYIRGAKSSSVGITQAEVPPAAWTVNQCAADYIYALKRSTQVWTTAIAERLTLRPYVHIRDAGFHTYL
jgi:hypothetical protein